MLRTMRSEEMQLEEPTVALVSEEGAKFDDENRVVECALAELFRTFPHNTEPPEILLKVAAINQLYFTQVLAVETVAAHIADLKIDTALNAGLLELVNQIAKVHIGESRERTFLSFASKYCNWHRPASYPIYDSRARECLSAYRRRFGLFPGKDLWEYPSFCEAVTEFRYRFGLQELDFKHIDKFLYRRGDSLIAARSKAKAAARRSSPSNNAPA